MEVSLKYILRKQGAMVWTGFIWLGIGTREGGKGWEGAFKDMEMNFVFHKVPGVS
jgi:hypothetical protein